MSSVAAAYPRGQSAHRSVQGCFPRIVPASRSRPHRTFGQALPTNSKGRPAAASALGKRTNIRNQIPDHPDASMSRPHDHSSRAPDTAGSEKEEERPRRATIASSTVPVSRDPVTHRHPEGIPPPSRRRQGTPKDAGQTNRFSQDDKTLHYTSEMLRSPDSHGDPSQRNPRSVLAYLAEIREFGVQPVRLTPSKLSTKLAEAMQIDSQHSPP